MAVTGLFISTNGNIVKATFDGLRDMQRAVGGLIEPVDFTLAGHVCSLYVDEEGLMVNEPIHNQLASALANRTLVGDAFVIGGVGDEGESLSLHLDAESAILSTSLV
jgi:hypothetical protein